MALIKVWCLPQTEEKKLMTVFDDIVKTIVDMPAFGIKDKQNVLVLFPTDMMQYGLGMDIVIEVTGLVISRGYEESYAKDALFNRLAKNLASTVQRHFPNAKWVKCFAYLFNAPGYAYCTPAKLIPVADLFEQKKMSKEMYDILVKENIHCLYDIDYLRLTSSGKINELREEFASLLAL